MCSGYCTNGENFCKSCECEEKCDSKYPVMCDCRKGDFDLIYVSHSWPFLQGMYGLEKVFKLKNHNNAKISLLRNDFLKNEIELFYHF